MGRAEEGRDRADVALVTYRSPNRLPREDEVLAVALRRRGLTVTHPIWDDPEVDWSASRLTVVRSTWDYWPRREAFLDWVRHADRAGVLWNPPGVLRWNTDKRYLRDLARKGVPVVPTVYGRPGRPIELASVMDWRGWLVAVVKPAISAAGDRTFLVGPGSRRSGQRRLNEIARKGMALIQPYLGRAAHGGERSLMYLGGRYSHAVERVHLFPRGRRARRERLCRATAEMRAVSDSALAASPGPLLYARVDLIEDDSGAWRVLEVELTEPSLFFVPCPSAARTFAAAIDRELHR